MKKLILVGFVFMLCMACGGGKYSDLKNSLNDLVKIQDDYVAAIEKAGGAKDVAAAINKYTDSFLKMKPVLESYENKYPELKTSKEPPSELRDSFEKLQKSAEKLATASMTMLKYINDPEVQKATERLKELNK